MEQSRTLQIIEVTEVDPKLRFIMIYFCLLVICSPFICLYYRKDDFHGQDTLRLLYDYKKTTEQYKPVPQLWINYSPINNGSSYVPDNVWIEGSIEVFPLYFCWTHHFHLSLQLISRILNQIVLLPLKLPLLVRKFGENRYRRQFLLYMFSVTLISVLYSLAIDGTVHVVYHGIRDKFITWMENNIADVQLSGGVRNDATLHPFTLGVDAPFFLVRRVRYPGEDVVLECEYNVTGGANAEPIPVTTWWRKDGNLITESSKHHINVNITNIDNLWAMFFGLQSYKILSTLTIEVIEASDYGRYTCDFVNPMRWPVQPYSPKNNSNYSRVRDPDPETPRSECKCKSKIDVDGETNKYIPEKGNENCFSEFLLQPPPLDIKTVNLRPGGILITTVTYETVASVSDIKVDVTFEEDLDSKAHPECCSFFIKMYWALFRRGRLVDLPMVRLLEQDIRSLTHILSIIKYKCICKDSFGEHKFLFYRDHYNSTVKKREEVEMEYPTLLKIEPQNDSSNPLLDSYSFCGNSEETFCHYLRILLENSYFIFYTYDVLMAVSVAAVFFCSRKVMKWSASLIGKPLRRLCFSRITTFGSFPAVVGPQVTVDCHYEMPTKTYNIFLSYSDDDVYVTEIAIVIKGILENSQLTVFDSVRDILPGHMELYENAKAVQRSECFIIIFSSTYTDDRVKLYEFEAIKDAVISQSTRPQDRLLIVKVDNCDIVGFQHVPCIHVPRGLKEDFSIDTQSVKILLDWIKATRPPKLGVFNIRHVFSQLSSAGFSWKSVMFIIGMLYFAQKSPFFPTAVSCPD